MSGDGFRGAGVKLLLGMPASPIGVPGVSLVLLLLANVSNEAVDAGRLGWNSRLLSQAWPRPGCDGHFEDDAMDGRSVSLSST